MLLPRFLYEAEKGGAGGSDDGGEGDPQNELTFDAWIKDQDEKIKSMLEGHTKGLKTALESERGNRKDLEKQLRDLAGKAEKGSEAQEQLTKMADDMAKSDQRADFYEAAHAAGVTNLKLAYTVAVQDEMFDRRGQVNFETLKQNYPELFGAAVRKPAPGGAGNGTGGEPKPAASMNDWIRKKSGRT